VIIITVDVYFHCWNRGYRQQKFGKRSSSLAAVIVNLDF